MTITIAELEAYAKTVPQCDCDMCKNMCRAPCTATVKDAQALINAGYASYLRDWRGHGLYPQRVLHDVDSLRPYRCIFQQEDGHCELHLLGLKPLEGRMAYHKFFTSKKLKVTIRDLDRAFEKDWARPEGQALLYKFFTF